MPIKAASKKPSHIQMVVFVVIPFIMKAGIHSALGAKKSAREKPSLNPASKDSGEVYLPKIIEIILSISAVCPS